MKSFIVLLGLMVVLTVYAGQEVVVAVDQGNPPFMVQQKGTAGGVYPSLIRAVFERMGVDVDVKAFPWKRALQMARHGDVGIGGMYKTEERLKHYDYSLPLYTERVRLYVRKGHGFKFETLADLEGKTIGALSGWSYGDAFDQVRQKGGVRVYEVSNDTKNFYRLIHGRLDGVLALEQTGDLLIHREGYQGRIVALENPLIVKDAYLVFAKQAQKKALLNHFNATLKAMKEDGSYDKVIRAYLGDGKQRVP